jgi:N-acetylglucosamine-6-phosphate deacetylase
MTPSKQAEKISTTQECIQVGEILLEDQSLKNAVIGWSKEGFISFLGDTRKANSIGLKPSETFEDFFLSPGMIDIHINGHHDVDAMEPSDKTCGSLQKYLYTHGVTSFLLTWITASTEHYQKLFEKHCETEACLGLYLEGPFIHPKKRGTHPEHAIQELTLENLEKLLALDRNNQIELIALAPERAKPKKDLAAVCSLLKSKGIRIALGHSNADYEESLYASSLGCRLSTHLFNAMTSFHHRKPGLPGFSLIHDQQYVEFIPDGFHTHPALFELLFRCKPLDKIIIVTDAVQGAGLGEGSYQLGETKIRIEKGRCLNSEGNLAGSALTMDQAFRNLKKWTSLSKTEIFQLLSLNPARYLGLDKNLGSLNVGKKADLVLWRKSDLKVCRSWKSGKLEFSA